MCCFFIKSVFKKVKLKVFTSKFAMLQPNLALLYQIGHFQPNLAFKNQIWHFFFFLIFDYHFVTLPDHCDDRL
jgi:hypothetical protein